MSIIVEELIKNYQGQLALQGVSFEIKTGEVVGFLGPNGAGKTTTMQIMTCCLQPTSGTAYLNDFNIQGHTDEIKQSVGYLPENNPLYEDMPIIDYLRFCAQLQDVPARNVDTRVREMISVCGLGREKHKKIQELSKGYHQRVGIAQAMIHDPKILILDEPTSGLDPNQIVEIRRLIKELGTTKTVLLSSHILSEVEATCDRILIINKGKIVANGTPAEIQSNQQGVERIFVQIEGPSASVEEKLLALAEVSSVKASDNGLIVESKPGASARKVVFSTCATNNWFLLEMRPLDQNLEDLFRKLTN